MNIIELKDSNNERWNKFVKLHSAGTIYHLHEWRDLIYKLFGHKSYYLFSEDNSGDIIGILPMIRLKSRLFGDYIVSMPYVNYGSAIAATREQENELMEHANSLGKTLGVQHIEFRDVYKRQQTWPVKTDKVAMILDLPAEEDVLWQSLGSKLRAQIKRPLRENPEVLHGNVELLEDFYSVFSENMRDLGTPVYPKLFFKTILETFPENCHLVIIRLNNKAVCAGFLIAYKQMIEIPWASSLREANPLGMNMLLYWEVIKYAREKGYQHFDFGRSTIDSGTYRFKKQWGAKMKQLYWHYWLSEGQNIPQLSPSNAKYKFAIASWKKMPVFITNIIGPGIVKNLP
jgi:serine/alanine adding enzyme